MVGGITNITSEDSMIKLKSLIKDVRLLRENTNTTQLEVTANKVADVLNKGNIPHFIVGGYAIQHYGYARLTNDIDIIVPNRFDAIDYLTIRGFKEVRGNKMKIVDTTNKVEVDVLEGGEKLSSNSNIPLPTPTKLTDTPNILDIVNLINIKLDSYSTSTNRLQDGGDIGKLINIHNLPLNLYKKLNPLIKPIYTKLWHDYTTK